MSGITKRPVFLSTVVLFATAHFTHHLLTALVVPLLPFIRREFALSYTQSGLLVSAFTLAYGLSQLPAGWLADRLGPRLLITVGIVGVAVMGFLVGLSRTAPVLAGLLVGMGLAAGGYHPSASSLIAGAVEAKNRGKALGFHVVGGSTSHFLAPLLAGAIASAVGWRGTFLWTSLPVLLFGAVLYLLMHRLYPGPDRLPALKVPTEASQGTASASAALARRKPVPAAAATQAPSDPAVNPQAGAQTVADPPMRRVRMLHLVVFLVLTSVINAFVASVIAFVPLFMVDFFRLTEERAALALALVFAAGYWGAPAGGYLADRLGSVRVLGLVGLASGPLIALFGYVPLGAGFTALLLVFGTLMFVRMPTSESFLVANTNLRIRSTVLGVYFFAGMEGGALLTPILGYLIDRFGFRTGFALSGAALAALAVACVVLLSSGRNPGRRTAQPS